MCSAKILVSGLEPHDAGKTTLCKAIIHSLRDVGVNLVPFKPHSGISYWTQFGTFKRNLKTSTLVCKDIMELEETAQSQFPLEVLNPVNRLVRPAYSEKISEEDLAAQAFVAQRFTYCDGENFKNRYYLNESFENTQLPDIKEYFSGIKKKANEVRFIHSFEDIAAAYYRNFNDATISCYNHVRDRPLIVESFNDAAYPFNGAEDCEVVLCISSHLLLELDSSRYFDSIDSYRGSKSKLQLTTSDVFSPSQIKERFQIEPLTTLERSDSAKLVHSYLGVIKKLQTQNFR